MSIPYHTQFILQHYILVCLRTNILTSMESCLQGTTLDHVTIYKLSKHFKTKNMNALPQDQDIGRIVGLVHQQPLQAGKEHIIGRSQHLHTVDNIARKVDTLCYIIKAEPDKHIQ